MPWILTVDAGPEFEMAIVADDGSTPIWPDFNSALATVHAHNLQGAIPQELRAGMGLISPVAAHPDLTFTVAQKDCRRLLSARGRREFRDALKE